MNDNYKLFFLMFVVLCSLDAIYIIYHITLYIYTHIYIYIKYVIDLKLLFFKTLWDWMSRVESHTISSIYDLMDAFNLCSWLYWSPAGCIRCVDLDDSSFNV